jgi:hypothetical protein
MVRGSPIEPSQLVTRPGLRSLTQCSGGPLYAVQVEAFFEFYPRRVGQVLFVDAPWVFYPAWEVIRPLMRKYAALVRPAGKRVSRGGVEQPC